MEINIKDLGGKVGEIAPKGYKGHAVNGYIAGIIPVKIQTGLTQEEWDDFCDGKYSREDLIMFQMQGKFI